MVDPKEGKSRVSNSTKDSNLMMAFNEEMFKWEPTVRPVLLANVEETLHGKRKFKYDKDNLQITIPYNHGEPKDTYCKFKKTGVIYFGEWKVFMVLFRTIYQMVMESTTTLMGTTLRGLFWKETPMAMAGSSTTMGSTTRAT